MKDKIKDFLNQDIILIILSDKKKKSTDQFSKVTVRPFLSDDKVKYQFEYTVSNKVIHKNFNGEDIGREIIGLLTNSFNQCIIYGGEKDYHMNYFSDKLKVKVFAASKKISLSQHNKKKEYILSEGENIDFLKYLGVMNEDNTVVKSKYNKFRQINKYLELIMSSIDALPKDRPLKIVDFGCGKAYLTFALYYYVVKILKREAYITGLDLKDDVIDFCNNVAKELNYTSLEFQKGNIKDYSRTQDVDMVIMLHACDNATDEGIVQSLKFNAKVIISVPCCQHEFFKQIKNDNLQPMLQFGILKERFSALATDALRAQLLQSLGYEVTVMEFIETEHTPKNIAIKAVKRHRFSDIEYKKYTEFKNYLGLCPYIERRLTEENLLK